jgi:hypothetical protein
VPLTFCVVISRTVAEQGKVELTTLVKFFFPRWFYLIVLLILIVSLLSLIIASLIVSAQATLPPLDLFCALSSVAHSIVTHFIVVRVCAQTLDFAFVAIKQTCAVEFYPDFGWRCVETAGKNITPFGDVRSVCEWSVSVSASCA